MRNCLPKVIAAHDLSGFGKASLAAVIPILSVMGCYVCPLQTAALSTVTGVFSGYTFTDLTRHMHETIAHWKKLNLNFDYIYSGFLGSPEQTEIIAETKRLFGSRLVVDPVFADDGELYQAMNDEMVESMKKLCCQADIITPNITEAMFLLGEDTLPTTKTETEEYLIRLCEEGAKTAVITSCSFNNGVYVGVCSKTLKKPEFIKCRYYPESFHGTGDIFTTVLLGGIINGKSLYDSAADAVDFVRLAIDETVRLKIDPAQGVVIETVLNKLSEGL